MAILNYKITYRLNRGLKVENPKKPLALYFRFRLGRQIDFNGSIGLKVALNDWDTKNQRLRAKAHLKNRDKINSLLTDLEQYFESELLELAKNQDTPTREQIKTLFNNYINPPVKEKPLTLFEFIDKFIEDAKTKVNPTTKKIVAKTTLTGYVTTRNILQAFSNEVYKLNFNKITLKFYYDFIDFCENKSLSYNTIGKHIKTLKTFMLSALNKDLHNCKDFQLKEFSKLKEDTESIYLNDSELMQIYNLDLTSKPHLDKVKDLFLIGAYTGLRFSDWAKVNKKSIKVIDNTKMLLINTQKTSKKVAIPLHNIIEQILNKYQGAPPFISSQKVNEHIKTIGKLAQINELVSHKEPTYKGLQTNINKPKFELIKTHTARRSFCTNMYLQGMQTIDIMAISGHTTEKSFLKYIKVSEEQRALKIAKHSFFSKTNLKVI